MSNPVMAAMPTSGNLLAAVSLAASKLTGIFIDASAIIRADIAASMTTGATAAATSGVKVEAYHVKSQTTTAGTTSANGTALTAGATTVTVASATGIAKGQVIVIGPDGTGRGETVTVSNVVGNVLTISATTDGHANGAPVYLIVQTPAFVAPKLGENLTAANTTYGTYLPLPTGAWFLLLTNTDAANAVTVEITGRNWTGMS